MLGGGGGIPLESKRRVWLRDVGHRPAGECPLGCGRAISVPEAVRRALRWPAVPLRSPVAHFGHIRARSRGGGHGPDNLRAICPSCNLDMGTTDMREYLRRGGPAKSGRRRRRPRGDPMDIDQASAPRMCLGVTATGEMCRNRALEGGSRCAVHRGGDP